MNSCSVDAETRRMRLATARVTAAMMAPVSEKNATRACPGRLETRRAGSTESQGDYGAEGVANWKEKP
jgi:hypothetical protein